MSRIARTVLFSLTASLLITPALAADPPEDLGYGVLGIYTEPAATPEAQTHLEGITPGTIHTVYFVLYHADLTSYNLGGFEFSWRVEPAEMAPSVVGMEWGIGADLALNFGDEFNLLVGHMRRDPHAPDDPFVLFSADLLFMDTPGNAAVFLGPAVPASIAGEMVYADFVFPEELDVMKPNNAGQTLDDPVFFFNPTVATEQTSLTGIKALFD